LPIPVFRNLFLGSKKPFLTGFLRISFFSCVFWRNFSQERGFEEVTGIPFFTGIFRRNSCGQEFLWAGIPVFTQDSSGIRRIPVPAESCRLRPATKEGSLLSKIWTKIDIFNLSPEQDLTMVSAAPVLCWRLLA
jgi:hypothetical protein